MWTLTTQLALVAIIVAVATTVALLLRSRRPLHARFAAFAGSVSAYYVTALITGALDSAAAAAGQAAPEFGAGSPPALISARILSGVAVIVAATTFFDAILGEAGVRAKHRQRRTVSLGIVLALVGFVPLFPVPATAIVACQAIAAAMLVFTLGGRALSVLRRSNDVESQADRVRLRYLAWGGIGALLGFACDLGAALGWPVPPLGGLGVAVYLYFISQALLVSRLLDLHELLGKALVFGTLALILAVVYGLLVVWVGERRGLFLFNTLIASSLILILFEPLKTYLEETTTRLFFREHVTFARAMRQISRDLASVIEPPRAVEMVLDAIYNKKRATHTSIYFLDQAGLSFSLQGHRGPRPAPIVDGESHPGLFSRFMRERAPLLRDFLESTATRAGDPEVISADRAGGQAHVENLREGLDGLRADLVVPLRAGEQTIGLLCLRDERLNEAYASDEIAALMQVGEQLAINVENSRLFDVLRERDRLATLGEMSAGLAHEIRNPLASIKGAAQVLDPAHLEGEDAELLEVIVSEVNRLNTVVTDFLNYARPFRGTFSAVSVDLAVRRTAQVLAHDLGDDIEVKLELADDLPEVNGDAEQLQQVMINLVLNAADAMDRKGTIHLTTRLVADVVDPALVDLKGQPTQFVEVRVRDEGPGMPASVRDNLFIPFFTTKDSGTGLGLALCQRIIQHHGGTIQVLSREGAGTTFTIRLPSLRSVVQPAQQPEESEPPKLMAPEDDSLVPAMPEPEPKTA